MSHADVYRAGDMIWIVAKVVNGNVGDLVSVEFADGGFAMVDKKVIERIEEPRFCIGDYVEERKAAYSDGHPRHGNIRAIHKRIIWFEDPFGGMHSRRMDEVFRKAILAPAAVSDGEAT